MTITVAFIHWSSDTGGVKCKFFCDSKNTRKNSSKIMLHPARLDLETLGLQSDVLLTELLWYVLVSLKVSDLLSNVPRSNLTRGNIMFLGCFCYRLVCEKHEQVRQWK